MEKTRLTPVSIPEEHKLMPIPEEKENKPVSLYVHINLYLIAFLCQGTFFSRKNMFQVIYYLYYIFTARRRETKRGGRKAATTTCIILWMR